MVAEKRSAALRAGPFSYPDRLDRSIDRNIIHYCMRTSSTIFLSRSCTSLQGEHYPVSPVHAAAACIQPLIICRFAALFSPRFRARPSNSAGMCGDSTTAVQPVGHRREYVPVCVPVRDVTRYSCVRMRYTLADSPVTRLSRAGLAELSVDGGQMDLAPCSAVVRPSVLFAALAKWQVSEVANGDPRCHWTGWVGWRTIRPYQAGVKRRRQDVNRSRLQAWIIGNLYTKMLKQCEDFY
ncbi:B1143G03.13 [Oryza sativa (japonica cultivar-group)]